MRTLLLVCLLLCAAPAIAQPNLESVAKRIVDSRPVDLVLLRQICDQTDALRAQFGEDDPRVQDGEVRANAIKGMFTRRIAYALHQLDPRFGLRRKDAGQRAIRPVDGLSLSTDVLLWRDSGQVIDVMTDRYAFWGMTPGDVQPLSLWVEPLPEIDDAPVAAPPTPPVVLPPIVPPPTPPIVLPSNAELIALIERILEGQQQALAVAKDTNVHVVSMDRTLTQTLGSVSKFVGKYIAPAVGGYFIAKHFQNTPPATPAPAP